MNRTDNRVTLDAATGAPRCPWHGPQRGAEYKQQDRNRPQRRAYKPSRTPSGYGRYSPTW